MRNRLIASIALGLMVYVGCIGAALAQSGEQATLSWILPNQYENGSSLNPATDLTEIRVYHNGALALSVAGTETSAVVSDLPYGSNEFWVTSVATNGNESVMSNADVKVVVDDRKPRPPTLLQVLIAWLKASWARWFA